jgi:ABC-2 type transport system permease protein/sodium transport system permease protein
VNSNDRLRRLVRLTLKELREILRDRRTILTLVLMPLLLYPLMSVAFQQFFVSQLSTIKTPHYKLGFENESDAPYLTRVLYDVGLSLIEVEDDKAAARDGNSHPFVEAGICRNLTKGLEEYDIHVGLRLLKADRAHNDPRHDLAVDVEVWYREDWIASRDAVAYVDKYLTAANEKFLEARLKNLQVTQRAAPLRVIRKAVQGEESTSGAVSITAVIPFILILMTVTGAVYPAIDLTAGERERGTLEVLVAAPIPRIGVLLAKYVAVLTVALMTAAANLLAMTITLEVSGLGRQLFGDEGVRPGLIAAIFGLLLLFAAFFSALLLAITSSARSFKEAQAYLIPLMLVALAPGVLGMMPGVELSGILLVTPLANIVLLGRDLFALKAGGAATIIVVVSTLLYAAAAIAVAARIFGAESVLYSSQSGWSDLFRRPRQPQTSPTVTAACLCLAVMFPAYFVFLNLLGRMGDEIVTQLVLGVVMTAIVLGAIPLAACQARRVPIGPAFRFPDRAAGVFAAATVVGLSFWIVSHEAVLGMQKIRDVSLDPMFMQRVQEYADKLRDLPAVVVFLTIALAPAVFEEAFFRGYLFSALRSRASESLAGVATTIVTTAIVFGAFHLIAPNPLASERFVSSTLVGLVLGWLRWRTGTVLPGMLLHTLHNGLLIMLVYYEPQLSERGIGIARETHIPTEWVAAGVMTACLGLCAIYALTRGRANEPAT